MNPGSDPISRIVLAALAAGLTACAPEAATLKTENAEAELVAARDVAEPGQTLLVALPPLTFTPVGVVE